MALPFYEGLRACYPAARVTMLCSENVAGLDFPWVFDRKIALGADQRRSWRGLRSVARKLAEEKFDLSLSLPTSFSASVPFFLAKIPHRVGFAARGSEAFLTAHRPWEGPSSGRHKSSQFLDLLMFLRPGFYPPIVPKKQEPSLREKWIVIAPGAANSLREWPYFPELISRLRGLYPSYRIIVVGSADEAKWRKRLKRVSDGEVEDWIGKTSLSELKVLCRRAALVIANDSGAAHVAATLAGAPTLTLFGPGDPSYVSPVGALVSLARVSDLPCMPCESRTCRAPFGYQRCLRELSVDKVLTQVRDIVSL
jgi:ADP-heptose:LPS heptosyltransferase